MALAPLAAVERENRASACANNDPVSHTLLPAGVSIMLAGLTNWAAGPVPMATLASAMPSDSLFARGSTLPLANAPLVWANNTKKHNIFTFFIG